jgi:alpha-mannosidase
MSSVKTVHLIFNAHLDPVWLWSWRDGLDEVLNTSAYVCNLLDRHPDLIYSRCEAWLYEQIRLLDPALFRRIVRHVRAGRWSVVGGWYIQPDCNLPSGFALRRQIALGREWFQRQLGKFPQIAYNVDSFGHAATLPGYLREAGQPYYVMMRPQEHELALPARLFRWRGYTEGPEVTTFRIARAYCTPEGITAEHILAAVSELPAGVNDTMCFVGIGDHGGGPTESMIEWCRAHRDAFAGLKLVFSSPEKFFRAIRPAIRLLPLVVGELQMHAIGCYTVHRSVKVALRKAEHRLVQAEAALKGRPPLSRYARRDVPAQRVRGS